jgi:hypothetical protein
MKDVYVLKLTVCTRLPRCARASLPGICGKEGAMELLNPEEKMKAIQHRFILFLPRTKHR